MNELLDLIKAQWPELAAQKGPLERILRFYELVLEENALQNLTRLISPQDFFEGHLLDVQALLKSGLVRYPAMDMGSGAGVPGIPMAILDAKPWVLAESEGKKAEFLSKAIKELGLDSVEVFSGRAEVFLKDGYSKKVGSVVARAVGPVDRIFSWLRPCSTWNNLVLLKGPGWKTEWEGFKPRGQRKELSISGQYEYAVGPEKKQRIIVRLDRG